MDERAGGRRSWLAAYSFICLSAWYVARSMPLAGTGAIRVVATALAAAALSAAMWLVLGRLWMALVATRWPAQGPRTFAAIQTLLFGQVFFSICWRSPSAMSSW